ncbi:broad substrate specificity ATP-binding cassette transporter ABCG2-like [Scyliorhinus canicula]|uniref:broad substrate specificity ATP-binding cassette transporter ABCG2-like n=1 Tax=Scyliorhinus canicula TaxID=7830 RepID=UPI0018F505DD|nr:broad substrate specificity ATP-binding cassette transporter ABCG2-like [Scyliorhinus canicula]
MATQNRNEKSSDFPNSGPILTFHNLRYVVNSRGAFCRKGKEKEILCCVSGMMKPGMNAILGPTGSGKTSLLDVLANRKDQKGLKSGQILLNGRLVDSNFNLQSAYVVQDDVLMGTLTVKENLEFSANLRLPRKRYTLEEKQQKVNKVIDELGLKDCANTKIGTEFIRGISGGERKRCSIGMELITSPSLLFLDEPTTGLDANTASSIMQLLHALATHGRTIIFSIHQPRYSIYKLLDYITLMSKGNIVYQGHGAETINYFKDLGYECEPYNNPSDFFLDVINEAISPSNETSNPEVVIISQTALDPGGEKNLLAHNFQQSKYYDYIEKELKSLSVPDVSKSSSKIKSSYANPFWYQLYIMCGRTIKNLCRNPQTSVAQVFLMLLFGILNGLIYYQIPHTMPEALQNRIGAFFFIIINQVFGNLSAVEIFIQEKSLFLHEKASGYYRTSAYFLSKILADVIPNRIIPVLCFAAISYFMMGLKQDAAHFFLFCLTLSLTSLSAVSLAFLVSASVNTFAVANALIAIPYVFMMVFGGFLVNLNKMLQWLAWLKWISIFRYGLNALIINELKGQIFYMNSTKVPGEIYMIEQNIDFSTWGFWQNEVALLCMTTIFLFLAFIQLIRINKWK